VPDTRSPELVRQEIALERERLAQAVDDLRDRFGELTDMRGKVGSRLVVLAPTAFAAGFVLSGGVGATMRYLARRGRDRR
jgi:hypothetical protein